MSTIIKLFRRLRKDESGVTAIEYGLIAGAISVAIIAGVYVIGPKVGATFTCIGNSLSTSTDACTSSTSSSTTSTN